MYILITIVFIAELIIAFNLINWIRKADKKVCAYNDCVKEFNPLVEISLQYARCLVGNFNEGFEKVYTFIKKKQEQIIFKILVMIAIYSILILFKIKTTKASKIYKLIGVIRDIAIELAV